MVPIVYMTQIVFLAFATNLPVRLILFFTLMASALVEEVVKSIGIVVLVQHGVVKSVWQIIGLSFLSALGFLIGEKLLLLISINMVSQSSVSSALFGVGLLLFIPLIAHFIFTTLVTSLSTKARLFYIVGLAIGTLVHFLYDWRLMGGLW